MHFLLGIFSKLDDVYESVCVTRKGMRNNCNKHRCMYIYARHLPDPCLEDLFRLLAIAFSDLAVLVFAMLLADIQRLKSCI